MNRLLFFVIGLSVLVSGCSESSPSSPASEGTRSTTTFTVPLLPSNEVPAIANADAGASGTAVILLTTTKDGSENITSAVAEFQITVTGFPAGTRVTDAHVHAAAAGSNGSVAINAGLTAGELAVPDGAGSVIKSGINVPADRATAILRNPAGFYFNVHTALNPDGAVRGQLAPGVATADPGAGGGY